MVETCRVASHGHSAITKARDESWTRVRLRAKVRVAGRFGVRVKGLLEQHWHWLRREAKVLYGALHCGTSHMDLPRRLIYMIEFGCVVLRWNEKLHHHHKPCWGKG